MKKHHKIILGSFSTIIIIFMIASGIMIYGIYLKQNSNYNELNSELASVNNKIAELTTSVTQTKQSLTSLDESFNKEISQLKASTSSDFSGIIEDAVKSVVTIRTDVSQGTGFIITDDGYIVTNAHVLVGGHTIQSLTYEQEAINTQFIGYDGNLDIALLKISGKYRELELADSNDVQVGEKVIAIGNPLGLQFSVSEGIVSAKDRAGSNGIEAYIQTDAALNPGNSGGPLINKKGEIIGINNFKIGEGESLGFALESNYMQSAINDIARSALNQTLI